MAAFLRRVVRSGLLNKTRQIAMLSIPVAHCAASEQDDNVNFKVDLSHEALIRQACLLSVNSSSQVLTQVLIAISEAGEAYRNSVLHLMQLLEDSILILTSGNSQQQEEISEMILSGRIAVEKHQKALRELVSLMEYVEKLATSTAETAFLAGAENSSTIICERLNSALQKIKDEEAENKKIEEDLLLLQQKYIKQISDPKKLSSSKNQDNDLDTTQITDSKKRTSSRNLHNEFDILADESNNVQDS